MTKNSSTNTNQSSNEGNVSPQKVRKEHTSKFKLFFIYLICGVAIIVTLPIWFVYYLFNKEHFLMYMFRWSPFSKNKNKPDEKPKPQVLKIDIWGCNGRNLPFVFGKNYFVYIETEYNEMMNTYIRQHINELRERSAQSGFKFMYVPEIANMTKEELSTAFPAYGNALTDEMCNELRNITTVQFTEALLKAIGIDADRCKAGFLRLECYEKEVKIIYNNYICNPKGLFFKYADFAFPDNHLFETAINDFYRFFLNINYENFIDLYAPKIYNSIGLQSGCEESDNARNKSDVFFSEEQEKMQLIAEEIRARIEFLKQGGYMELLMHTIGKDLIDKMSHRQQRSTELQRIRVTEEMKITLPDMNNHEVKMPSLARALYIFFLRHEEGVEFKQLVEFESEIFAIYRLTSNRKDEAKMRATVAQLVDSTDNKVNECASRIKVAFLEVMDDFLAKNYYLTQRNVNYERHRSNGVDIFQSLVKKITLPRNLVEYPQCLTPLHKDKPACFENLVQINQDYDNKVQAMTKAMSGYKQKPDTKGPQELYNIVDAVLKLNPFNDLAHFYMGYLCCNKEEYNKSIAENTVILEHDAYLWNIGYINRAEAYLYAKEYEKGLADIHLYFRSIRRNKEMDLEAMRIRSLLEAEKKL